MKQKFIDLYMDWATRTAQMSYAVRLKVGAVIVKNDSVISYGYNGMPAGASNVCEDVVYMPEDESHAPPEMLIDYPYKEWTITGQKRYRLKTKPEVLHAEMNALMKLAKSTSSGNGSLMFQTHAPCLDCAKGIYQAGIKEVYYKYNYRSDVGIDFLRNYDVKIIKI
jgi:dCMP deaminase